MAASGGASSSFPEVVELNVGGQVYVTRHSTLLSVPESSLAHMFAVGPLQELPRDSRARFFIDRDGFLFRYVLDYLRDKRLALPEPFPERERLRREAEFFRLADLAQLLLLQPSPAPTAPPSRCASQSQSQSLPRRDDDEGCPSEGDPDGAGEGQEEPPDDELQRAGFLTVAACRGSPHADGRDNSHKPAGLGGCWIAVCGRIGLAKEVFGEAALPEDESPSGKYTCRLSLPSCQQPEQAFDRLAEAGFHMVACNATGSPPDGEDNNKRWSSYTEYVFYSKSLPPPPLSR